MPQELMISDLREKNPLTIFHGRVTRQDETPWTLQAESGAQSLTLSLSDGVLTMVSYKDETQSNFIFDPNKPSHVDLLTPYGLMTMDLVTTSLEIADHVLKVAYRLELDGGLVESFHFEFILGRKHV